MPLVPAVKYKKENPFHEKYSKSGMPGVPMQEARHFSRWWDKINISSDDYRNIVSPHSDIYGNIQSNQYRTSKKILIPTRTKPRFIANKKLKQISFAEASLIGSTSTNLRRYYDGELILAQESVGIFSPFDARIEEIYESPVAPKFLAVKLSWLENPSFFIKIENLKLTRQIEAGNLLREGEQIGVSMPNKQMNVSVTNRARFLETHITVKAYTKNNKSAGIINPFSAFDVERILTPTKESLQEIKKNEIDEIFFYKTNIESIDEEGYFDQILNRSLVSDFSIRASSRAPKKSVQSLVNKMNKLAEDGPKKKKKNVQKGTVLRRDEISASEYPDGSFISLTSLNSEAREDMVAVRCMLDDYSSMMLLPEIDAELFDEPNKSFDPYNCSSYFDEKGKIFRCPNPIIEMYPVFYKEKNMTSPDLKIKSTVSVSFDTLDDLSEGILNNIEDDKRSV